jgi:hypothetical protein
MHQANASGKRIKKMHHEKAAGKCISACAAAVEAVPLGRNRQMYEAALKQLKRTSDHVGIRIAHGTQGGGDGRAQHRAY